jgi:hypothetical protein
MANLALQPLDHGVRRLTKWTRALAIVIVVLALMALSFALGRATIGDAGSPKPAAPHATVQPTDSSADARLSCRRHRQC